MGDKKSTDNQEIENQTPDEKLGADPKQSTETDVKRVKEFNGIDEHPNLPESTPPIKASNNAAKPDTTAVQDLFAAIGLGFGKTKKKASSSVDKDSNAFDTAQTETARLDKYFIQTTSNDNLEENVKERTEVILEDNQEIVAGENAGKVTGMNEAKNTTEGIDSALAPTEGAPAPVKRSFTRKLLLIPLMILLLFGGYRLYAFMTEPRPPNEDVVATYSGKNLTKEDLLTYIKNRGYKEEQHGLCTKHGFDHSKCDQTEECETHPIDSMESYRQIIKMIAVQQIVDDWAKEKGITQKDEVKHDFKHLVEEVSLDKLVDKVHQDQLSPDKIDKWEVQKYYDANKDTYKDKPFNEVEGEIRSILAAEKEKNFFPEYLEKLKKNAGLTVNYDILTVEDPTEIELRKNEALFTIHGKPFTLGTFREEFKELSPETQAKLAGFAAKKSLIDQLIAKELLLEESGDEPAEKENGKEIETMKSQYLSQLLHKEEIDEKVGEISDEEAIKIYEEKKNVLVEPAKAQISLIRVDQGPSEAEKTRARQKIDEALQKLTSGADFAAIAKEYSSDSSAATGGEVKNWLYDTERIDPILRKTIFALQPNEVSGIFEFKGGYYIVKLRQKEEKRQRPFEEVKEQLKKALLDEKHHKREADLEAELLAKTQLVIYDSSLKTLLMEDKKTQI